MTSDLQRDATIRAPDSLDCLSFASLCVFLAPDYSGRRGPSNHRPFEAGVERSAGLAWHRWKTTAIDARSEMTRRSRPAAGPISDAFTRAIEALPGSPSPDDEDRAGRRSLTLPMIDAARGDVKQ